MHMHISHAKQKYMKLMLNFHLYFLYIFCQFLYNTHINIYILFIYFTLFTVRLTTIFIVGPTMSLLKLHVFTKCTEHFIMYGLTVALKEKNSKTIILTECVFANSCQI